MKNIDTIFDYRYHDESSEAPYQLVIERDQEIPGNHTLFLKFYQLLQGLLKPGREQIYFNDLSPALEFHYWKSVPKFAFVNELATLYEKAKSDALLTEPQVNQYLEHWLEEKSRNSSIYEGTIRLATVVDEAVAAGMDIPVGTTYTYIPEPINDLEAFHRLKFLMGPQVCEYLIREFGQKYKDPTAEIFASELAPINSFINHIDHSQLKLAFERHDNDDAREYLRITHGYYENHRCEQAMGNNASMVYGRYILYKSWLEDRLRESFSNKTPRGLPQLEPGKISSNSAVGQELFNLLYQRGLLSDFFQVPAPPVKGRFWYDINDAETDDPAKVVRVNPVAIRQKRRANHGDFQTVLDQVNIIKDKTSKAYQHFIDDLIACLQQMVDLHRNLHKPHERDEVHYHLIELAENFTAWLKPQNTALLLTVSQQKPADIPLNASKKDIQILDYLKKRTDGLPDILHLRAAAPGYQLTEDDKKLLMDTYSELDDILKEVAAFINVRFPGCERHVKAWYDIDFDTKIGDIKIVTTDREHIKREYRKGIFDLKSLIKILRNETILLVGEGDFHEGVPDLKQISSDHPLEHYTNKEVIPNQKLVNDVITFFETGEVKALFTPVQMLNLIDKQKNFVMANYNDGGLVMQTLDALPLNSREKHSLFGFLLKWFGGYPVNNMNDELNETLKLVQSAFLSFAGDTPEKQYCRVDQAMRNKFEKYGIAFTASMNHGVDVTELLAAMDEGSPPETMFRNFPELFAAAIKAGIVEDHPDRKDFLIAQSALNYQFNVWLQESKNWEYRNEEQYEQFLTLVVLKEFLASKTPETATVNADVKAGEPAVVNSNAIIPKLTIKQIALICHYTDCQVTRATANGIVGKYGHTSGDKLFNAYSHYRSKANRVGTEPTKKKNDNKLELFESVQRYLSDNETAAAKISTDLISLREAIDKLNLTL